MGPVTEPNPGLSLPPKQNGLKQALLPHADDIGSNSTGIVIDDRIMLTSSVLCCSNSSLRW